MSTTGKISLAITSAAQRRILRCGKKSPNYDSSGPVTMVGKPGPILGEYSLAGNILDLSAIPWYPSFDIPDYVGGWAHINIFTVPPSAPILDAYVYGREMRPANYINAGFYGLLPGNYTVTMVRWNSSMGMDSGPTTIMPLTVSDYGPASAPIKIHAERFLSVPSGHQYFRLRATLFNAQGLWYSLTSNLGFSLSEYIGFLPSIYFPYAVPFCCEWTKELHIAAKATYTLRMCGVNPITGADHINEPEDGVFSSISFTADSCSVEGGYNQKPVITTPTEGGSIAAGTVTISWDHATDATAYVVNIYNVDTGSVIENYTNVGYVNTYNATITEPGNYVAIVVGVYGDKYGAWSTPIHFTVTP